MFSRHAPALLAHAVSILALSFPAAAPAQQIVQGEENLLHRAPLAYPVEALEQRIPGIVIVQATLNERGVVTDAQVTSGPVVFRKDALKSILDWHYSPGTPSPVQVVIDFQLPAKKGILLNGQPVELGYTSPGTAPIAITAGASGVKEPPKREPLKLDAGIVKRIQFIGLSSLAQQTLANRLPVQEGDSFQIDMPSRLRETLRGVDEHLSSDFRILDFDGEKRYFELRISYAVTGSYFPNAAK